MRITETGQIQISAPFHLPQSEIETFIEKQKDWILKTRQKLQEREKIKNPFQEHYENGQELTIFGSTYTLCFEESQLSSSHLHEKTLYFFYRKEEKKELNSKIQNYLLQLLLEFLERELKNYSERLQLFPTSIKIKTMKSAWGIYHKRGNYITFNILLLAQKKEFISYVVVHELCHLRYFHHQKEFWTLVASQIPNYLEIKKADWRF